MVLYAFNLEVARAPWVTKEEMIAEMRLQWWFDAIDEIFEDRNPRRHEVVSPLVDVIREAGLPRAPFDALIKARRADIYRETPAGMDAIWGYLDGTSGGLLDLAARALGAQESALGAARCFGRGMGAANLLVSLPALETAGWKFFSDDQQIRELAVQAKAYLKEARATGRDVPLQAGAAFRAGWQADVILARTAGAPQMARDGGLASSEFQRRLSLAWLAMRGNW